MFALDVFLKYSIMLLMMTMNGWINLIIALGMVLGYIVFMIDNECRNVFNQTIVL